jgi:hypothetical protein
LRVHSAGNPLGRSQVVKATGFDQEILAIFVFNINMLVFSVSF